MTKAELAQAINDASDQISKGIDEVKKAIEESGNSTPEIDAALNRLQGKTQELDDLNPDAPAPAPAPEPAPGTEAGTAEAPSVEAAPEEGGSGGVSGQ